MKPPELWLFLILLVRTIFLHLCGCTSEVCWIRRVKTQILICSSQV